MCFCKNSESLENQCTGYYWPAQRSCKIELNRISSFFEDQAFKVLKFIKSMKSRSQNNVTTWSCTCYK